MSGTEIQRRNALINSINNPEIRKRLKDAEATSSFNKLYKYLVK
jgi:hypothetical protein